MHTNRYLPIYRTPSLVFSAASATPCLVFSAAATTPSFALDKPFINTSILICCSLQRGGKRRQQLSMGSTVISQAPAAHADLLFSYKATPTHIILVHSFLWQNRKEHWANEKSHYMPFPDMNIHTFSYYAQIICLFVEDILDYILTVSIWNIFFFFFLNLTYTRCNVSPTTIQLHIPTIIVLKCVWCSKCHSSTQNTYSEGKYTQTHI